jgi:dienelactone hydrolase
MKLKQSGKCGIVLAYYLLDHEAGYKLLREIWVVPMQHKHLLLKLSVGMLLTCFAWLSLNRATAQSANDFTPRELTVTSGDVQLAGTLYLPGGAGPFPAAVIMHGSGPDTRVVYIPDAHMLARGGIASFIFDKRGTGASSGDWKHSSLDDLMADGLAAIALLQSQPEIDPAHIGIVGSSQGAWLAPFMAARSQQVAFFVQITGSATPLANQEMWDDGNSLQALGFSERAIETEMKALHLLYSSRELIRRGILPLGDEWFVYYDPTLDPMAAWADVRVPALVLFGGQDASVPTQTSLKIVKEALAKNGHPASRTVVFPQRGHALGGASRNQDATYATLVTGWIKAVANGQPVPAMPFPDAYTPTDALHWYGLGAHPTPWYASAGFQLPVILAFLFVFVLALIASLLPWLEFGGGLPRLVLGLSAAANTSLLAGLLFAIGYLLNADANSAAPAIPLGEWLFPLAWASVVLAGSLAYFWRRARSQSGNRFGRAVFTLMTLAAWGFIPFLLYWGVLGGRL